MRQSVASSKTNIPGPAATSSKNDIICVALLNKTRFAENLLSSECADQGRYLLVPVCVPIVKKVVPILL